MVDFRKFVKKPTPVDATNLVALFESRDRQTSHTELRTAQRQALDALTERLGEQDLVLKVSTGAGKTAVGLIYLQSHMSRSGQPAVYLCPTVQLVGQVCDEAQKIGLSAVEYPARQPIRPVDGTAGNAIIVCTYDKLFNGRSTFDRDDVRLRPCAMVLDDAHSGIDKIRAAFSLSYSTDDSQYDKLIALLDPACSHQYPGKWADIRAGKPRESVEVPYWTWATLIDSVSPLLAESLERHRNYFPWPLVRDIVRWCRCVVSGGGIEIAPLVLPVEKCRAFSGCAHRLFMSATLADDAVLARDLGCATSAVENPIRPAGDKGLGERMVLPPSLISTDLDREWVARTCGRLSKRVNVVVLSPSEQATRVWTQAGAEYVKGDDVAEAVRRLRKERSGNFVVFAQRYDGVDLPDDACRILVLDGLPTGESITDAHDTSLTDALRRRLVHRIEQGMGRAVRSHVDYAVVILAGPSLANFVARADVLAAMNPDTRAQLRLAIDLAKLATEEEDHEAALLGMIKRCLDRDAGWKQYYQETVRESVLQTTPPVARDALQLAAAMRAAFRHVTSNDARAAASLLAEAADKHVTDAEGRAPTLQVVANYTYAFDEGKALEIQKSAHMQDRTLFCPPSVAKRPQLHSGSDSPAIVARWFGQFENPNGALAAIHDLRARLSFDANYKAVEQALVELAPVVGAEGSRPEDELGEGPDCLWLWSSHAMLIEVKSENETALHKSDGGQLLLSLQWYRRCYPNREPPTAVVAAKHAVADRPSDFPDGTRVLTPDGIGKLLQNAEKFYGHMVHQPLLLAKPSQVAEALRELKLMPDQFRAAYTTALKGAK